MLEEVQHFGITVSKPIETLRFYNSALMFPFVSMNMVRGSLFDKMYELNRLVNFIAWYQFPRSAMELFYLPTHPPRNVRPGNIMAPGYCYAGYSVEGLDLYIERLAAMRYEYRLASHGGARALLVRDPSGINNVLFEQTAHGGRSCALGLEEAGLTVANPAAYEDYFNAIGLARAPDRNDDALNIIKELFRIEQPVEMVRYGHIRLLHFPKSIQSRPGKFFPHDGGKNEHNFNDTGVRHVAYIVDDARLFYENARARGVHFIFAPETVPGGTVISYFHDPEGNTIEIAQPDPASAKTMKFIGTVYKEELALLARVSGLVHGKTFLNSPEIYDRIPNRIPYGRIEFPGDTIRN